MIQRKTIQCALVLETVNSLANHATADEIFAEITKSQPSISRGTVYNNLQRLCDAGMIRKREVPDGADRYDHNCSDHYHIICESCGKVTDVDMEYMAQLEQAVHDKGGYLFTGHNLVFKGICPNCRASGVNGRKGL